MIPNFRWKQHQRVRMPPAIHRPVHADHSPSHHLPRYIDLRPEMPPVMNQKDLNTCTAATFATACEYLIKRYTGRNIQISQLFIYFNGRYMDQGTYSFDDDGASRKNMVKAIQRFGICKEEVWPFKRRYLNKKPPDNVYDEAKRTMVTARLIPLDVNAIRTSLAKKLPAIVGIKMEDGSLNEASNNGGYLQIPDPNNMDIAHSTTHAILVVGYDDKSQQFIVRNSWGRHWGDHGYFYMPYNYLRDQRLVNYSDGAWVISHIERKSKHY